MKQAPYKEALEVFTKAGYEFTAEPVTDGLINQSFKITDQNKGHSFLLQQINHHIFQQPELVQRNYEKIWRYLAKAHIDYRLPEPQKFAGDSTLYCDSNNNYWRVFEFIEGTKTITSPENPAQTEAVAAIFGRLTACLADFDVTELAVTIPHFHNLSFRYAQFKQSLKTKDFLRLKNAAELIKALQKRERYTSLYEVFIESSEFPLRVMHHDAKIGNVLFDNNSGHPVCPVDFDTTMPGYYFSDLGDMIRSMAASADESSTDFTSLAIRKDYYEAVINGYTKWMGNLLTDAEKKYIHHAGLLIIYMQALRFITDYLNGDTYYKTIYPEQNFDRAANQLQLLQSLEVFLQEVYAYKS
jgi:Ser/Thr protein kinase RdoA (MazF antagonist)